jgi:peptide/nickel transport system permease protein
MMSFVAKRLVQGFITLLLMSALVFGMARLTGNPLDFLLSPYATQEDYDRMARELGLDQPWPVQYGRFVLQALTGNMGDSLVFKRPVSSVIAERLPATLDLGLTAMGIATLIAIPMGVLSAVRRNTLADTSATLLAVLGQSAPNFLLGILLIEIFSVQLGLFPSGGSGGFAHILLPAVTLGWFVAAGITRLTRSSMLDVLEAEYIKLARSKGLPEYIVIWKHAFLNAVVPVLTFAGVIFAQLLVGSVVVETVFAWPGVGRLAYQAVVQKDFPLLQAIVLLFTLIYIVMNIFVDIAFAWIDPRARVQ